MKDRNQRSLRDELGKCTAHNVQGKLAGMYRDALRMCNAIKVLSQITCGGSFRLQFDQGSVYTLHNTMNCDIANQFNKCVLIEHGIRWHVNCPSRNQKPSVFCKDAKKKKSTNFPFSTDFLAAFSHFLVFLTQGIKIFLLINTFTQQGHLNLIKSDCKDIYNVQKISITNKCISNKCGSFHLLLIKKFWKKKKWFPTLKITTISTNKTPNI